MNVICNNKENIRLLAVGGTEAESKVEGEDRVRKMVYRGWYVRPFLGSEGAPDGRGW